MIDHHRFVLRRALVRSAGALLLNLLASVPALAVLSVGSSAGCSYAKIQDAINAAAATDVIHVEPSHTYAEHLLISDKSLTITACACGESVCATKTRVAVDGTTAIKNLNPLLRIQATAGNSITVSLSFIDFSNAGSAVDGGGIAWAAQGHLTLSNVEVTGNSALNGGGIYFNGTGTGATLTFGSGVSIDNNTATGSGGGVHLEGLSSFSMNGANDRIFQNVADSDDNGDGDGGGISVVSPASATIGSAVSANAVISGNMAHNGGGIAFVGGTIDAGSTTSSIQVVASDLDYPVRIEDNTAKNFGGGLYLQPKTFASATINAVQFSASGYRIDANHAFDGSAIYADTDSSPGAGTAGGKVVLQQTNCHPGVECDTVAGNQSLPYGVGGMPASVVVIKAGGQITARYVRMHDNAGEYLLQSAGSRAAIEFSLLYSNHVAGALIAGDSGSQHLQISQCTIAANTIEGAQVVSGTLELLDNSLIDQPTTAAYSGSGAAPAVFNVVASDSAGLPADPSIQQQQPLFVDPVNDDFRLLVQRHDDGSITASPGVDYAPAGIAQLDIGGRPYDQDVPDVGAAGNVHDLGAFEMQPLADRVFASGMGDPVMLAY